MSNEFKDLIGETIKSVHVTADKTQLGFQCKSGENLLYEAEGDCCSSSWIEHVSGLFHLIGATVTGVIEREMPDQTEVNGDYIQYYGWTIQTTKGYFDIEMRNSSNGYYGGYIVGPATLDPHKIPVLTGDF